MYVCNSLNKELAKWICLTLFPTRIEMNYSSEGLWAVRTKLDTIIFKHLRDETPERYNGSQNVVNIAFSGNGKKMIVSGKSEVMMFDL